MSSAAHPGLICLSNGLLMPQVQLGTYQLKGEACQSAVSAALKVGYRAMDSASVYRNEEDVRLALASSGLKREEVWLTTKLQPKDQGEKAYAACLASLEKLGTDYCDLYLIHWPGVQSYKLDDPVIKEERKKSWLALQRLYKEGKCRAIGVSNYMPLHLTELCEAEWCEVKPMVNQFEIHPLLQQREAQECCRKYGVAVQAYSSLARGAKELLEAEAVQQAAKRHGKTAGQVVLRWAVQQGIAVLPKSQNAARIQENADVGVPMPVKLGEAAEAAAGAGAAGAAASGSSTSAWSLTEEEMAAISALEAEKGSMRTCWDPNTVKV